MKAPRLTALNVALAALLSLALGISRSVPAQVDIGQTTTMPGGRQFHGSAVLGQYLYVFGGHNAHELYTSSVAYAPIHENSLVGQWRNTTPMPDKRAYIDNSTLVFNDMVYIVGGTDEQTTRYHDTAIYARPNPDGSLGTWQTSSRFGSGGAAPAAVATPGYLHIMGGKRGTNNISAEVWSARINPDGTLGQWGYTGALPEPLWFHNAGVVGGRVYVWGGLNSEEKAASRDVYSAPILSSGLLGEWKQEAPLPTPFYGCPSTVAGPYLISFAPRVSGGDLSAQVWFNYVGPSGPTQWTPASSSLPVKIYHASATDYRNGAVYVMGGRESRDARTAIDPRVFFFVLGNRARETQVAMAGADRLGTATTAAARPRHKITQFTFQAEKQLSENALPGFHPIGQARELATVRMKKPLLVYFNTDIAVPCHKQNELLVTPAFKEMSQKAVFAWVDIRDYPQFAQQLGIWQVPTWVIFDQTGNMRGKHEGGVTLDQLNSAVTFVAPGS